MTILSPTILHIAETTSTNTYLKELVLSGEKPEGFTVYTDYQNAGRGQRGNLWESEHSKNLLFSTLLYPKQLRAADQFILSQIVSLAIKDILSQYTTDISVKWPNDIYWKDKKVVGILIENGIVGEYLSHTVIGVGININQDVFVSDAPNPVSLRQITGMEYSIENILRQVIGRILFYYQSLPEAKESIQEQYKKSLFRREGFYPFEDKTGKFVARIKDIETSGLLELELQDGEIRTYAFKEVRYIL